MSIERPWTGLHRGLCLLLSFAMAFPAPLRANPVGGTVMNGEAVITEDGATLTVDQTTERAVIDWAGFSIGVGELTQFNQPNALSAVLNRVTGGDLSQIFGTISSNGSVFLINPNGILVGASGVVNTQGFVASTLDVDSGEFMFGSEFTFTGPLVPESNVTNEGAINAALGDVVLIGQTVSNTGSISAPNGTAALAAGSEVLYKPLDEERVFVQAGTFDMFGDANGILNQGTIQAAAAELKAAGGNVYSLAINNSGTINADQVETVGGRIYLTAESGLDRGTVNNSGTLATTKGEFGGEVRVSGDEVTIEGGSTIVAADLQVTGDARILLNGDLSTDGSQTYNGPVVIGGDLMVYTSLGDLIFNGTVDSMDVDGFSSEEFSLTVATDQGFVSLDGAVGGLFEIGSLTIGAGGGGLGPESLGSGLTAGQIGLNADVTTAFSQDYNGAVEVGADAILTSGGYVYFAGTVDSSNLSSLSVAADEYIDFGSAVGQTALGNLDLATAVGNFGGISFLSSLDSDGAVVLNSDSYVDFNGPVGARALAGLDITSADYIWFMDTLDSGADAEVSLTTLSSVDFDMAVGASSLGSLTIGSGDYVYFGGDLDSDGDVTVNAASSAEFYGAAGARSLGALAVDAADIRFSASVLTTGAQTYSGPVIFSPSDGTSGASFTSGGGDIAFLGDLGTNGFGLTVDAGAGDLQWDGAVNGADVVLKGTNLTMNGDVNSTGAGGVVMVAANSFDNTSASAITTDPLTRWLVYSKDEALDVAGGLTGESEAGVSYPAAPAFAGNGFLYSSGAPAEAADEPAASELDNFEASLVPPSVDASGGGGGDAVVVDGGEESAPGEFGSDDGGGEGGGDEASGGDPESGDGEEEKDGDE